MKKFGTRLTFAAGSIRHLLSPHRIYWWNLNSLSARYQKSLTVPAAHSRSSVSIKIERNLKRIPSGIFLTGVSKVCKGENRKQKMQQQLPETWQQTERGKSRLAWKMSLGERLCPDRNIQNICINRSAELPLTQILSKKWQVLCQDHNVGCPVRFLRFVHMIKLVNNWNLTDLMTNYDSLNTLRLFITQWFNGIHPGRFYSRKNSR